MIPLVFARQMRELEQAAEQHFGMPPGLLMENAGAALARHATSMAASEGRFLVLCGRGNNGGDGLVAARKLREEGRQVWVEVLGGAQGLKGEPARNALALAGVSLSPAPIPRDFGVEPGDVVVDALFGTGLNRAPEGECADAVGRMALWREKGARVLAADVPSGLNADTGVPFSPCVEADRTVCFGFVKAGVALEPGASFCGQVECARIGLPTFSRAGLPFPALNLLESVDIQARIPKRNSNSHKGTYGHVLVVAGSWGKSGAAALCALGALRAGAGLVTIATRPEALVPALAHAPEVMGLELVGDEGLALGDLDSLLEALRGKQALVIGPGLPHGEQTAQLIVSLLEKAKVPCVLDADALNAVAPNVSLFERASGPLVLTPHPGEMARLLATNTQEIQRTRLSSALKLAKESRATVVLKGARTVLASPDGQAWVNPTGNPGMATGGTGDVLAGICGGLLAQGLSAEDAALCAAYVHGMAGDLAAARCGQAGLLASDIFGGLKDLWQQWSR